MGRFTGTVKRCPNSPYMIFKDKEHFHTFKHEELQDHEVLDTIVELLNTLDKEVALLKCDVESLSNPDVEYKYNIDLLEELEKEYKMRVKSEWDNNFELRLENKKLKEENSDLKKEIGNLKNYLRNVL